MESFFSLLGDVALIFPDSCFLYGLIFFLLAHIAYIIAFSFHLKFPAHPVLWVPYFAFAILLYLFLFPNLPADLRIPVALYAFLLSAMAAQAMGRLLILKNAQARSAAIGGLLFLLSDSLLALDRFRSTIPAAYLFILTSYYLAQWLIAASTLPITHALQRRCHPDQTPNPFLFAPQRDGQFICRPPQILLVTTSTSLFLSAP